MDYKIPGLIYMHESDILLFDMNMDWRFMLMSDVVEEIQKR